MNIQQAYDRWAADYDEVQNKTRDLEARKLQEILSPFSFSNVLELGCGTGKNTAWLAKRAQQLVCVDFSAEMLAKAKDKIRSDTVEFIEADITQAWKFTSEKFDLITFSLILEHIEDLNFIFTQVASHLKPDGIVYVGELHPFKQYQGSKARFETVNGIFELDCFIHHVTDFFSAAESNGLNCVKLQEAFDEDSRSDIPRLLTMVFQLSSQHKR